MAHTRAWRANCSSAERRRAALVLALGALLWCALSCVNIAPALAATPPPPLVIVLSSEPEAPFVRRLAAELSLFGYRVQVAERSAVDVELTHVLQSLSGAALISVDPGGQTAEVVVAEAALPGAVVHERERLDPRRRADTNAAVLAERFRARLTELGISPTEPLSAAAMPSPRALAPSEPARRLWLAAALGVTSGGLGPMPELELELRAFPVSWLSTSAFGKLTPVAAEVSDAEGEARVRLLSVGVVIDAYPVVGNVSFKLGLGGQLVNASMSGEADPPWAGQDDSVLVAAGVARAGVGLRLSGRVRAELSGFAGVCSPRIAVRFAGRNVADFGQPFIGGSLGLAWGIF